MKVLYSRPKKGVPAVAAAQLQRWSLHLAAYDYNIEFRSTKAHGKADALSRLPLPVIEAKVPDSIVQYPELTP